MCDASKVANDWVVKGFHIHIGPVELAVFPDHTGGVGFRPFFAVKAGEQRGVAEALKTAKENCLSDQKVRAGWIQSLNRATLYMLTFDGEPSTLANGRMLEFKFLIIALERYTV